MSIRPSAGSIERHLDFLPDGYETIDMPLQTTILIAYAPAPFQASR